MIVEKRPMEEGRPLRSEEGRQKGPAINFQIIHSSHRVCFLFVHLFSSITPSYPLIFIAFNRQVKIHNTLSLNPLIRIYNPDALIFELSALSLELIWLSAFLPPTSNLQQPKAHLPHFRSFQLPCLSPFSLELFFA